MIIKKCTCTYQTLVNRGFKPIDHSWACPLNKNYKEPEKVILDRMDYRNTEISPFKSEWLSNDDKIKYEGQNKENHKIGTEKARITRRRFDANKI